MWIQLSFSTYLCVCIRIIWPDVLQHYSYTRKVLPQCESTGFRTLLRSAKRMTCCPLLIVTGHFNSCTTLEMFMCKRYISINSTFVLWVVANGLGAMSQSRDFLRCAFQCRKGDGTTTCSFRALFVAAAWSHITRGPQLEIWWWSSLLRFCT